MRGFIKGRAPRDPALVGPNGAPLRDEAAHRRFRENALASSERVVWRFPEVAPDWKYRSLSRLDAAKRCEGGDTGLESEVHRIYLEYVKDFMRCIELHEKRYNPGCMPQVSIPNRWNARFAVQHLAQMKFHVGLGEIIIDATEETDLLNPDADVGRVVSAGMAKP
ncbi:MAG: hypothetical protein ACLP7W_02775 [Solirubrobacteraceae bacterium]